MKPWGRWGLALLVVLLVTVVRAVSAGRAEWRLGERLLERGDEEGALVHLRRAARWYVPWAPHVPRALDRLASMAVEAERRGDEAFALACWRAVRGAILATRSLYVPHTERLARAEERIAWLMAREPPAALDARRSERARYESHLALLRARPGPRPWAAWLALLGFAGWVGAAWRIASDAFDEEERFRPRRAARWGLLWLVGFAAFVAGLRLA